MNKEETTWGDIKRRAIEGRVVYIHILILAVTWHGVCLAKNSR